MLWIACSFRVVHGLRRPEREDLVKHCPADGDQFGNLDALALTKLMTAALGIATARILGTAQPVTMLFVSTLNYATVQQSDGTVFGGATTGLGLILDSTGDPFTKDAHSDVKCVVHGKKTAAQF